MVNWGGGASGAASGAALGSAAGPYGAAIGGAVGGLYGLFSGGDGDKKPEYQDRDEILRRIREGYGPGGIASQQAPQLLMGDDPFRRAQLAQLGQLQGIAGGQQQGAGELAVQRQYANALAAQQAQARMARGGNAALAYRNAANQSAALGSTAAGMGQQSALQDQMNAQGLLGQVGASGRGADINVANANAGYQMGTNQANNSNYLALLSQLSGMSGGQLGPQTAAQQYGQQRNDALLGAGIQGAGQWLAMNAKSKPTPGAVGGDSGFTGDSSNWGA